MRLPGEDINDYLPDWFTKLPWWQEQHAKGVARDERNLGTPRDKRMGLFEWIKSIISNPNISSIQASQILNNAGVVARDLMMAMNPMGTAYGATPEEGPYPGITQDQATELPPVIHPARTPETFTRDFEDLKTENNRLRGLPVGLPPTRTRVKTPAHAEEFATIPAPRIDSWGNVVEEKDVVRAGEFAGTGRTPARSDPWGFENVKRGSQGRSSIPAPTVQTASTGIIGRTPYQGPGKRGFTPGKATTAPRRFGPH